MSQLLPQYLLYADSDNPTERNLFENIYGLYELSDFDALVYPKGFNLDDETIPVWILIDEKVNGHEVTFVLQTHIQTKTETLVPDSDYDTLRVYTNRKDAYSYVERISSIVLGSCS